MNVYRIIQELPVYVDRRIVADNEIDAMTYFVRTSDTPTFEYICSLHTEDVEITNFPEMKRKRKISGHEERLATVHGE